MCYFEDVFSNQKSLNFLKAQLQFINRYIKGQIFSVSSFTFVCVSFTLHVVLNLYDFLSSVEFLTVKKLSIWASLFVFIKGKEIKWVWNIRVSKCWKNFNFWVKYSFILWKAFVILAYWLTQEIILTCPSGTCLEWKNTGWCAGEIKSRNVKLVFFLKHEFLHAFF